MAIRSVASFFSGVEANHVAIQTSGVPWRTDTVSEIEKFPCAVLAERCPDAVNLGDFNDITLDQIKDAEIAVGGPPCQSFSIAGKRGGMDDDRGNLSQKYMELLNDAATNGSLRVAVYENVPGILSDSTNAFGCLISGFVGGVDAFAKPVDGSWPRFGMASGPRARLAWRTLDAQWFGLAQRRRRVFIVVCFDKRLDPAKILFERKGVQGNTPPSRSAGEGFAADVEGRVKIGSHWDGADCHPTLNQSHNAGGIGGSNQEIFSQRGAGIVPQTVGALDTECDFNKATQQTINAGHIITETNPIAFNARQDPISGEITGAVDTDATQAVAFAQNTCDEVRLVNGDSAISGALAAQPGAKQQSYIAEPKSYGLATSVTPKFAAELSPTLTTPSPTGGGQPAAVCTQYAVRRLMPVETERLQGFPLVTKSIIFGVSWTESNSAKYAPAETQCTLGPRSASSAGDEGLNRAVSGANQHLNTSLQCRVNAARLIAHINLEEKTLELRSVEKSQKNASNAAQNLSFPRVTLTEDFAALIALMPSTLVQTTLDGRAASLQSKESFGHHPNGNLQSPTFGQETEELVRDANADINANSPLSTFTIKPDGSTRQNLDCAEKTWFCSVLSAIDGSTQTRMLTANFSEIEIQIASGWTRIAYRNKPADKCPDGPRYKAMGNSWAVPCVAWIYTRIEEEMVKLDG